MATSETAKYLQIVWEEAQFTGSRGGYADFNLSVSNLAQQGTPVKYGDYEVQPLVMLYIYDKEMEKKKARRLLEKMFKSDDLAVASQVIRFIGCPVQDLPDYLSKDYGQSKPAFFFLDSQGGELDRADGAVQAGSLFRKLNRLYRTQYNGNLSELTRRTQTVLEEIDLVNRDLPGLQFNLKNASAALDKKVTRGNQAAVKVATAELDEANNLRTELIEKRDALSIPALSKDRLEELAAANR